MEEKIKKALQEDGAFLEMFAVQILQNKTFDVHQSVYYQDRITNKLREIDVIGDFRSHFFIDKQPSNAGFNVKFIIECKYINTPWVILSSKDLATEESPNIPIDFELMGNPQGVRIIKEIYETTGFNSDEYSIFFSDKNVGYAVRQVNFNKKANYKDIPFEAINGLLISVSYTNNKANESRDFVFIIPIVLVHGNKLFKCFVGEENEIEIEEVKYGVVLSTAEPVNFDSTRIFIVTKDSFEEFLEEKYDEITNLEVFIQEKLNKNAADNKGYAQ